MLLNILQCLGLRITGAQHACAEGGACQRPGSQRVKQPTAQAAFLPARLPARTALSPARRWAAAFWFALAALCLAMFPLAGCLPSLPQPLSAPTQKKIPGSTYKTRALPACLLPRLE